MAPAVTSVPPTPAPVSAAEYHAHTSVKHVETSEARADSVGGARGGACGGLVAAPQAANIEAPGCCPAADLDDLMLLGILRHMPDPDLVALRVSGEN